MGNCISFADKRHFYPKILGYPVFFTLFCTLYMVKRNIESLSKQLK